MPKYIAKSLLNDKEWSSTISEFVLPKIKKFEEKLLYKKPIKLKPNKINEKKKKKNKYIINYTYKDKLILYL